MSVFAEPLGPGSHVSRNSLVRKETSHNTVTKHRLTLIHNLNVKPLPLAIVDDSSVCCVTNGIVAHKHVEKTRCSRIQRYGSIKYVHRLGATICILTVCWLNKILLLRYSILVYYQVWHRIQVVVIAVAIT